MTFLTLRLDLKVSDVRDRPLATDVVNNKLQFKFAQGACLGALGLRKLFYCLTRVDVSVSLY